jgi:hypothetical protein
MIASDRLPGGPGACGREIWPQPAETARPSGVVEHLACCDRIP